MEDIPKQDGKCDTFLDFSLEEIYDFHIFRIGGPGNSNSFHQFTYFTFLVIDEECLSSDPEQCIICCDAPDYKEERPTLKTVRVPLTSAASILAPLEQLTMTFTEALDLSSEPLSSYPPFTQIEDPENPRDTFLHATPAQARAYKEQAIALEEERKEPLKGGAKDRIATYGERYAMIFRTSRKESEHVTYHYQMQEQLAWFWGYTMGHRDNRTKESIDESRVMRDSVRRDET